MYRKFLLCTLLTAAVCLTACKKDTELTDDFTTTDSKNELEYLTEKSVTAVQKTDGLPEIVFNPEGVNEYENADAEDIEDEKIIIARQYFEERGFKGFYLPYGDIEIYGLTLDMNDFKDVADPFEGIDKKHFENIYYLTLENVDGCDLGFLSRFERNITVMDYSGSADLSGVNESITFDNYMGGDLSTLKPERQYRSLDIKNYSGEYPLRGMDECGMSYIYFENYSEDVDFSFLADCPNITGVGFKGKSVQAEVLAELLENTDINRINITVEDFSTEASDMLIKAAGSKTVCYELDGSDWNYQSLPTEGLAFYTSLDVVPDYPDEKWVCRTDTASSDYERYRDSGEFGLWVHHGSLVCRFSNFTDKAKTADFVSIFKDSGTQLTPIKFADGSTEKKIDFTVQANENADFDINEEIFDFGGCEAGLYKVVFDFDGEQYGQMFFIEPAYNGDNYKEGYDGYMYKDYEKINLEFLTDEQNEIFRKAYAVTQKYFGNSSDLTQAYAESHTAEEFLAPALEVYTYDYAYSQALGRYIDENGDLTPISADKGGNLVLQGNFFTPIYSDENEVTFKVTVINGHEDDQYHVWFTERNFHMVRTEEGWRFDLFGWWY